MAKCFLFRRKCFIFGENLKVMTLRQTFQSLIALHQEEFPYDLIEREMVLPTDSKNIVTVTGVRRCGKSSQLKLVINRLIKAGIPKKRIIYIGFDDERFSTMNAEDFDDILQGYREMYPNLTLKDTYMFFDEIQLIDGWELFVLRVYKNYCQNIFVTGSTSKMLSEEMASALRGYPDEYRQQTLSFSEYLRFRRISANKYSEDGTAVLKDAFKQYCQEGGYPKAVLTEEKSEKTKLLQSYFNTMLFRDMVEHYHISTHTSIVRYFLKRVMENITKPTSIHNIFNELKSIGMKISKDNLYTWIEYACQIYLFAKVPKYTCSLVKETSLPAKYYMADIGMRNAVLMPQSIDKGKSLENIVFNDINSTLSENDKIYYYSEAVECDFVIVRSGHVDELVQVCWELDSENSKREFDGLAAASAATGCTNCRIITFDQDGTYDHNGLKINVSQAWR